MREIINYIAAAVTVSFIAIEDNEFNTAYFWQPLFFQIFIGKVNCR